MAQRNDGTELMIRSCLRSEPVSTMAALLLLCGSAAASGDCLNSVAFATHSNSASDLCAFRSRPTKDENVAEKLNFALMRRDDGSPAAAVQTYDDGDWGIALSAMSDGSAGIENVHGKSASVSASALADQPSVHIPINWHIAGFYAAYEDAGRHYLHIEDKGKQLLWSPIQNKTTAWDESYGRKLRKLDMHVGLVPLYLGGYTSISHYLPPGVTDTSFRDYYEISQFGKKIGSFYVIARRESGHSVQRFDSDQYPHEAVEAIRQDFDSALEVFAERESNGSIYLVILSVDEHKNWIFYVVILNDVPQSTYSFGGNVFILPAQIIRPALAVSGKDLSARYMIIKKFMAEATPVLPSSLGPPVSATAFFSSSNGN